MDDTAHKQIAVIVSGIDEAYQQSIMEGIIACAKEADINIACFTSFSGVMESAQYDIGEYNIYNLVNFSRFDGAVLLTNTISDPTRRQMILGAVRNADIPAVVFDCENELSFCNIRIDNDIAMQELVQHIITEHHAERICYLSGPEANPEARTRLQAVLKVVSENHLPEPEIIMGDFRPAAGKAAAEQLLSSGEPLPDALICANDAMALEALHIFETAGVKVPEDLLVSGFDDTFFAQYHCPALTTVSRPLFDAGYQACKVLTDTFKGLPLEHTISLNAFPVFRESCGCPNHITTEEAMRAYRKKAYDIVKRDRTDVALLNRMTSALTEAETEPMLYKVLSRFLREMECKQCAVCLCEDWQQAFHESGAAEFEAAPREGYAEDMYAPLIWTEGKVSGIGKFLSEDMFPTQPKGGGHVSYFLPLHFRERCLGYYIITDSLFPLHSVHCHSIMMSISHSMENVRKLLHLNNAIRELDRLYVIDPLCNIYNRNGFIRLADKMFRHCMTSDAKLLIAFIDMDGLKLVNDNYGHDEGDFALRQLASVLNSVCAEGQICARFGGDEFIAIGADADDTDGAMLEIRFRKHLADVNRLISKPYQLEASIGTVVTEVDENMKLFSLISQADQIMYEQKKKKKTSRYLRKD